jgi:hypothetical protein
MRDITNRHTLTILEHLARLCQITETEDFHKIQAMNPKLCQMPIDPNKEKESAEIKNK